MAVASGVIPYEYAGPLPLVQNADAPCIGMSGILFEEAHFVAAAEQRRYHSSNAVADSLRKYINFPENSFEDDEATPNGEFLSSPTSPGMAHFIDVILNTRVILEDLWDELASDSDYDSAAIKRDWLRHACPSPSGGNFFRRAPGSSEADYGNIITTMNIEVLGGSGVLYDVDMCSMRYQPYARMGGSTSVSAHGEGDLDFDVVNGPLWPMFQKTDGTLINRTSRETRLTFANPNVAAEMPFGGSTGDFHGIDSITSGVILLDGDILKSTTHYLVAQSGSPLGNEFTYSFPGFRKGIGVSEDGTAQAGASRVYVTPIALSEGFYRVVTRNDLSDLSFALVPSGEISQWPPQQAIERSTKDARDAYSVFDGSFWVTDWGGGGAGNPSQIPSGLGLLSPFTGKAVWVRHADERLVGNYTQSWGELTGLERLGANAIWRMSDGYFDGGFLTWSFVKYDDSLDYVSETTVRQADFTAGGMAIIIDDFFYDSDNDKFFALDTTASAAEVHRFNSDFTHDKSFEATTLDPKRAARINNEYWALDTGTPGEIPGRHMRRFVLTNEVNPVGNIEWRETKIIQSETIPGLSGQLQNGFAQDAQVLTSAVGPLATGIWLLYPGTSNMFLLRVVEDTTAFYVVEAIQTSLPNTVGTNRFDLIAMTF